MTISEKLVSVAENMPKIYEAGQNSVTDKSKVIKSTVTGEVILLDDVSETPHNVDIQVFGDGILDYSLVEISVYGESLIKPPFQDGCKTENGITFMEINPAVQAPISWGLVLPIMQTSVTVLQGLMTLKRLRIYLSE